MPVSLPQTARAIRFLALGDSYTIGEGVEPSDRWPNQLAALLKAGGFAVAEPDVIAKTGWTTDELAKAIGTSRMKGPYELVSLLIGVNNQYRGRPLAEFRVQFMELLQTAINFAGGISTRVIVLSIPDWGVTPFAKDRAGAQIAREIDQFNAVCQRESVSLGTAFVDITGKSRAAAAEASFLAPDGLHPSGRLYGEWAELALPFAQSALRA